MKQVIKAITNSFIVFIGIEIARNASVNLTNEIAVNQMTNSSYVPNLSQSNSCVNFSILLVVILITYLIWRKEIKSIINKKGE